MNDAITSTLAVLRREFGRATRFGLVGVLNAVVNYSVFMALVHFILRPIMLDETPWAVGLANACAWAVAVSNSYVLNAKFTFRAMSGGQLRWRDYITFASAGLFGMVAETASLLIADIYLELWVAKIISIFVAFAVNFTATRLLVFRKLGSN